MKNAILFVFFSALLSCWLCPLSNAQVTQEWAAIYNSGLATYDIPKALCVDPSGNVYVTGRSGDGSSWATTDYRTIKYSPAGSPLWVQTYDYQGATDVPNAMVLDADPSLALYVTGYSLDSQYENADFATLRYNSNGGVVWASRYNSGGNNGDYAAAMALDAAGNIYVAGTSYIPGHDGDYTLVKYNPSGVQQWAVHYDSPSHEEDNVVDLAVDADGNAYVTGTSRATQGAIWYRIITVRYNSAGVQQWVATRDAGSSTNFYASAIALDDIGWVYVTGSKSYLYHYDYITLQYNGGTGGQEWEAIYASPGNYDDKAVDIAASSWGVSYVTGKSGGSIATLCYDINGAQQWLALHTTGGGFTDSACAIVGGHEYLGDMDVYVTGVSLMGWNPEDWARYLTIKYNPSGVQQWETTWANEAFGFNAGLAIAWDEDEYVYVTGECYGTYPMTWWDYGTIKYSQAGPVTPVVLSNFSAFCTSDGVQITWQTASEIDCYGWQVQRSDDGSDFQDVSPLIPGYGTSSEPHDYSYADYTAQAGQSYSYRLKQMDLGGSVTYSNPVMVNVNSLAHEFRLYPAFPNPFNASAILKYELPEAGTVTLMVFDVAGIAHSLLLQNVWQEAGTHEIKFDAAGLPSGIYIYRLQSGPRQATGKMVLIK